MRFLPKTMRKRYLVLLATVVLLLPLAGYWATEIAPFRTWARDNLAEQKKAAMSIGMPVSIDDVLAQYTLPDGAVNAADSFRAAIALLVRPTRDDLLPEEKQHLPIKGDYELKGGAALPEESIKVLDAYLAENAPALKYIDEALAHVQLQFATPLEPQGDSLVQQVKGFAQALDLLCMRGMQHAVHDRQVEVEAALLQMLQIAEMEYWDAEPTMQTMPCMAVERFAILLADPLSRFRLSPESLKKIGESLSRLDGRQTLRRIIPSHAAAIAIGINRIRQDAARPFGKSRFYQRDFDWEIFYLNCEIGYALVTGYLDAWHGESLYILGGLASVSGLTWKESSETWGSWESYIDLHIKESVNPFSNYLEHLSAHRLAAQRMDAVLAISRIVCAVESHRKETGALPDSLESLAVKLSDEEIMDPFTGELIEYKRLGNCYQIGSIGQDMNCPE